MDKNKIAVEIFNKLASGYQDKFMDVSLYGNTFDLFCDALPLNAEVLELACGPGNITKYILSKRPDLEITGTDLSENMIRLARNNNPSATFLVMDGRSISTLDKKYDAVMCGFFLPYLSKEEAIQMINDASHILNSNGILYISTMEDAYNQSRFQKGSSGDEIFMHYHEAAYLSDALKSSGFATFAIDRKKYPGPDETIVTDLILIAKKV